MLEDWLVFGTSTFVLPMAFRIWFLGSQIILLPEPVSYLFLFFCMHEAGFAMCKRIRVGLSSLLVLFGINWGQLSSYLGLAQKNINPQNRPQIIPYFGRKSNPYI